MVKSEDLSALDRLSMPGSALAIQAGCTCDPKANRSGRGEGCRDGVGYYVSPTCPLYLHRQIGASELAE